MKKIRCRTTNCRSKKVSNRGVKIMNKDFIESSFLGSLLLALYHNDQITLGNVEKYWRRLYKKEHTLNEIVKYIEKDKKTKLDLSRLCLVSHCEGKYSPLFTSFVEHNSEKYILPINPKKGYEGILKYLYSPGIEIHTFVKEGSENVPQ